MKLGLVKRPDLTSIQTSGLQEGIHVDINLVIFFFFFGVVIIILVNL